jgi:hypothetical protein
MHRAPVLGSFAALLLGCSAGSGVVGSGAAGPGDDGGTSTDDGGTSHDAGSGDAGTPADGSSGHPEDGASPGDDGGSAGDAALADTGTPADTCTTDAGAADAGCYAITCTTTVHSLQQNRDRLVADLAARKCTDSCTLWAALNEAERYIFLMDTTYFGDAVSRLYPPQQGKLDTALDHAVALYSINGPLAGQGVDGSGRGGNDYNRIYLGFDALAECVMRNFAEANPAQTAGGNTWVKSDDVAGPHAPFTQREMIYWYKAIYDLQSEGPQWHHWHQDPDFSQSGIDARLGVCGNTDRSLVESTIAFDSFHNSDPLGNYAGRGGYGWQIVAQYSTIDPAWDYTPTGCATSAPVNTDPYGGGTFDGMGPVQASDGGCTAPVLGDAGCGP